MYGRILCTGTVVGDTETSTKISEGSKKNDENIEITCVLYVYIMCRTAVMFLINF